MMRSTLSTFTKQTIGRVRRRTSTKQRSITLVVRNLRHKCLGKAKKESSSGRSRSMPAHHGRVLPPPTRPEIAEGCFGPGPALRQIDGLCATLRFVVVALAHLV